jgi:uncharacterized protein YndB with AHSA1/START domain
MRTIAFFLFSATVVFGGERRFTVETVVHASTAEVFRAWTDCERIKRFFAPGCEIEAREGGAFTMLMAPDQDPVGDRFGSRGARILKYEQDRALSFQWRGKPEFTAMNTTPLPTWVEIELFPLSPEKTVVRLTHRGFGLGEEFDEGFKYFGSAWRVVLKRLEKVFASK